MKSIFTRFCQNWLLPLLGVGILFGALTGAALAPTSATFQAIPPVGGGTLNDVALSASNDAWAVGLQAKNANTILDTQAQHWDGHSWAVKSTPSPHNNIDVLNAVADISPTNAWTAGYGAGSDGFTQALIEHWDGSGWSVVAAPADNGNLDDVLSAIAAISANDIWVAGSHFDTSMGGTDGLLEHWDGHNWSIIPSPTTVSVNGVAHAVGPVTSLAAISSTDIWATTTLGTVNPVAFEHWNGSQWSVVLAPGISGDLSINITGVAASASSDVWAVGTSRSDVRHAPILPFIEHWDGNSWKIVTSPTLSSPSGFLSGVTALSSTDAWAVGGDFNGNPLVEHWNGSQWSLVTVPVSAGATNNQLSAVRSLPGGTVIAVGPTLAILSTNG